MSLAELTVDDLRCIEHAELALHPGQNLIWGGNGSGKTSLLESIFLLGRGRSFRTRNSERLIRYGRDRLVVFGRVGPDPSARGFDSDQAVLVVGGAAKPGDVTRYPSARIQPEQRREDENLGVPSGDDGQRRQGSAAVGAGGGASGFSRDKSGSSPLQAGVPVGLQVSRADGTVARIAGSNAKSLTELTQVFPVQVIDPGIHKLVEEGGFRRRRWMDWGVFHVEHQFGDWWVRYTRALKQRNAALRAQAGQASAWDPELVRLGELIAEARRSFVEGLLPYWRESVVALCGLEPELHYFRGWAQDTPLQEALTASKPRDEAKRLTHPGPHRADLIVRLKGRPAREVLSRGQQKLVAVAMTLAQLNLLQEATQTTPTLLLDDPSAELDGDHLKRFIDQVRRLRSQLILTSLHSESQLFGTPDRVFHVEQGRVRYNVLS